jgi:hypothetical protein
MDHLYLATERSITVLDVSDRDHPTSSVSASLGPRVDDSCDVDPATIGDYVDEVVSVLPVGCAVAWSGGVPWPWLVLVLIVIAIIRLRRS